VAGGCNVIIYLDYFTKFAEVLPKEKHVIGKKYTEKIEGINT